MRKPALIFFLSLSNPPCINLFLYNYLYILITNFNKVYQKLCGNHLEKVESHCNLNTTLFFFFFKQQEVRYDSGINVGMHLFSVYLLTVW